MQLQFTDKIERGLKEIIQQAIHSGQINPKVLRMVILYPDNEFENLKVCIRNEWDTYFYDDATTVIGEINISEWLDIADNALEKQKEFNSSFIERAKEYQLKYKVVSSALTFDYLHTMEGYQAYLVCLREELFSQIENAIRSVAISYSPDFFEYVIGFATFKLPYNLEYNVTIQGFNHPMGAGPFYKARLSLPGYQRSNPYLKLYERGLQLFLPDEALYEKSEKQSETFTLDISEIKYAWVEDDEIKIRLEDEFENWELSAASDGREKGELSNEETFEAFKNFFNQYPEKNLEISNIPDPLLDGTDFQKWLDIVLENNLKISYKNLETIFTYSEKAFRLYLQQLPVTVKQYQQAEKYLASKLFYLERFQESYDLLSKSKKITESDSIHLLVCLFLLNQREAYDAFLQGIKDNEEQVTLDLLNTLWLLRGNVEPDFLKKTEADLYPLLTEYKDSIERRLLSVVLTRLYVLLNQPEKALFHLQFVPAYESFEQMILKKELSHIDYIIEGYNLLLTEENQKREFEDLINKNALIVSQFEKTQREKTRYEDCYYLTHKIRVNDYKWVCPIDADTFIAIQKDNDYVLILGKLTAEKTTAILQSVKLTGKPKVTSCLYSKGILYIPVAEAGIITYSVTPHSIKEGEIAYFNKNVKPRYESVAVGVDHLYVSNNGYLEVFELNNPEVYISKALYIESGYNLFIHHNLLVISAGAGLLILADISVNTRPVILSTIKEDKTPGYMHVEFIGSFLVSQSVFDIADPADPKLVCYAGDELAPTYYFAPKPEVPVISTGEEFLFTTLSLGNGQPVYTNWLESLNSENLIYERVVYNLATAYCGDALVSYSKYEIIFWEKGLTPVVEKIDIHAEVESLVNNCFQYVIENHPDFCIGKVHLQHNVLYQNIEIAFHASSSLATLASTTNAHNIPIVFSSLNLDSYCSVVLDKEYYPLIMEFVYDGDTIIQKLIHDPVFEQKSALHVLAIADKEATYLHDSSKPWKPYRSQYKEKPQESVEQIILSYNENLIKKLQDKIADDPASLNELLEILNKKVFINTNNSGLTNMYPSKDEDSGINVLHQEFTENESELECSVAYINEPALISKIAEDIDEQARIPGGFYENNEESYELRTEAFAILCSLPDRKFVREILFNGMKFGLLLYNPKDLRAIYAVDQLLTARFVHNIHGLWDEFGNDTEIRNFLMSNLNDFDNSIQLKIVYNCGHLTHPIILDYLRLNLAEGFNYHIFKGHSNGIDCSKLPAEVLKPLEQELLEKLSEFETPKNAFKQSEAEQQIVIIYAMLYTLGHERMPALVQKKISKALKEHEEYGSLFEDDDEYDDENVFLISIYRKQKVKRLLGYFTKNQGPLWPLEEAAEPYIYSWRNTIEYLWETGTKEFGPDFTSRFILQLSENIALDSAYEHDRLLAQQVLAFAYHHIQKRPELASLVEPLVLATLQHKEKFKEKTDFTALKDKSKLTLLQAAWNDLKNKDWDLAEQKANAILVLDPNFAQVYFLQARMQWLREGVGTYLANKDSFIDKAAHDVVTLARLYNLSGCALDVENRYEEALPYFKKAALTVSNDPMYVANVAEIYYKLGKPKEALNYAKAARANGNQADILKEIIENKGVIVPSSENSKKELKQEILQRNEIVIEVNDLSSNESIMEALSKIEAAVVDWNNFAKVMIFTVSDTNGKILAERDFFAQAIALENAPERIQSIIEKFIEYPKVKYVYRNPEETSLCHAVFELAQKGDIYLNTILNYLAEINMDHDVFNRENLIPLLEERYSQNELLGKMKVVSENLSEWYEYYLEG